MSGAHDGSVVCATLKPSTPSNGYSQRCGGRSARTAASGRPDRANELLDERQNARRYPRQRDAVQPLGIHVRAGLHTGECEVRGDDIGGIAVHIGARDSALAGPNDVFVSTTLRDLVIGSGLEFDDRGAHQLKGVPGQWHLFAVASP
jgi:class 3 adenylate cyclase